MSIYLMEAHAQDVWPLGQHVSVKAHKTLQDRIETAQKFLASTEFKIPMVVDGMDNEYLFTYLAHPERFYAFSDGKLEFKAQPENAYYPIAQIRKWLVNHFAENTEHL